MTEKVTITLDKGNKKPLLLKALEMHYKSLVEARDDVNNPYKSLNSSLADQMLEMYEEVEKQINS